MAGRKFNFSAAETIGTEQNNKKESLHKEEHKNKTPVTINPDKTNATETNVTLSGKAGTLSKKLSSASAPKAFDFRFIPRNKLCFYEENDYPQENIESLAEKILNMGLIHNLEVFYVLDTDSYIIDSGERRCRALDMLINKYKNCKDQENNNYKKYMLHVKQFENGYPCNVRLSIGDGELDQLDLKIRHYVANEEVRERDPAKTAKRIAELSSLYALRNGSANEKININKKIGEDLGLSDRQVKKYKSLQKLIPELKKKFDENKITLTDGSSYASLSKEEQEELLKLIETGADKKKIDELYQNIYEMKKDLALKEKEIKSLESEKEEVIRGMDMDKKNHKEIVEDKNKQIELLKRRLDEHKNAKELPDTFYNAAQLNLQIEQLRQASEQLKKSYKNYKKSYQEEMKMSPTPEEFKRLIQEILEETSKMIK